jgi:hypothetical protein
MIYTALEPSTFCTPSACLSDSMNSPPMQSSVPLLQSKLKLLTIPFSDFGRYSMAARRKRNFVPAKRPGINPSSNWIYVTDEETGSVIGGAQWNIYKENPYVKETAMLTPYWIPEGILKCVSCNGLFRLTFHYGRYLQRHRRSASPWFLELPPYADERTPYM